MTGECGQMQNYCFSEDDIIIRCKKVLIMQVFFLHSQDLFPLTMML